MMRRAFLALAAWLFVVSVVAPVRAQSTRAQINTYFSGTSGGASGTNCFPTSGTGNISALTLRTCMLELVASISAMYQDALVTIQGALTVNGNFSLTGSSSGATIVKAPATGGGMATFFPGSDTIVGAAATQTLTNKSIAGSEINSSLVSPSVGGTGVNNGSNTFTLGGNTSITPSAGPSVGVWNSSVLTGTTTLPSGLTIPTPSISSPTLSGTVAGAGTIPNSVLVNSSTTINGTVCTLGAACAPGGAATNFLTYGTPGSGNDTTAFNAFITACGAASTKQCYLPAGQYNFTTAPNCINQQINLYGDNLGATVLLRNYNEADPTRGLICISTFAANDSVIGNMGIYGKVGTTGGALLSINQGVGSPIGFLHFHDMNLSTTGTCTHEHSIYINGTANSIAPIGIRDVTFSDVTVFGGNTDSMLIAGIVGLSFYGGGGIFPAGCGSANAGLVAFQGTSSVQSTQVMFNPPTIQGNLSLDFTINSTILTNAIGAVGGTSVTNTANDTNVAVLATSFGGACQSNWVTSGCVTTTTIASSSGVLLPANGGTGTSTVFTAGSVVFSGASGIYAQDNAHLFWDDTNNRLGIGTAAPLTPLEINANTGVPAVAPTANTLLYIVGVDGSSARINIDVYGTGTVPVIQGRAARGTAAAPTAIKNADTLFQFGSFGYGATGFGANAPSLVTFPATEDYSDTAQGSGISLFTTRNTTVTRSVVFSVDGWGHSATANASGTQPTIGTCGGGSPSVVAGSSDTAGEFIEGTTASACTLTFAFTYAGAPKCTVSSQAALSSFAYTISASAITLSHGAASSTKIDYACRGQ